MNRDLIEQERRDAYSRKERARNAILECVHYLPYPYPWVECGKPSNEQRQTTAKLGHVTCMSCIKIELAKVNRQVRPLERAAKELSNRLDHIKREAERKKNYPKGCGIDILSPHGTAHDKVCGSAKYPYDPILCRRCQ